MKAGFDMIPTSSTINQLSIGDALAVSTLKKKDKQLRFQKISSIWKSWRKIKNCEVMLTKNKIPFINENTLMTKALKL